MCGIDDQIEFRRLLGRQVSRLHTAENLIDIDCRALKAVDEAAAVARQAARLRNHLICSQGRQAVLRG